MTKDPTTSKDAGSTQRKTVGAEPNELPQVMQDKRRLDPEDRFVFSCHPGLSCFKRCCGDVNIMLTPFDVLRLARRLKLSTSEFLDQHALMPVTKELHLPVVLLKMDAERDERCPFVGEQGCTVYEDRPWTCRMYPVGAGLPPARAGVDPEPVHFLFEDEFCDGHGEGQEWTVASWRANQGVDEFTELEQDFQRLVSHPWFIGGRHLNPKQMEMFFTACYDLDNFRRFVFESTFLKRFELEDGLVEELRDDDVALLRFGFRWLRFALFGEQTIALVDAERDRVAEKAAR